MKQKQLQKVNTLQEIVNASTDVAQNVAEAATRFKRHREESSSSMLEMSLIIFTSRRDFLEDEFTQLCHLIGCHQKGSSIRKMAAVGAKYDYLKVHRRLLPESNWTLLYKLSQVTPDALTAAANDGTLTSHITGRDIDVKLLGVTSSPHAAKPQHSLTLTWSALPDLTQVEDLMEMLTELSKKYGNFEIEPSSGTGAMLKKAVQQSQKDCLDEWYDEAKESFRKGLTAAWKHVPARGVRTKAFMKRWGISVEELKRMPINEALEYMGCEGNPKFGGVSYADLLGRRPVANPTTAVQSPFVPPRNTPQPSKTARTVG